MKTHSGHHLRAGQRLERDRPLFGRRAGVGAPGLRAALTGEHRELEASFNHLLASSRADAREDVAAAWTRVERTLHEHLAFEEAVLFPELGKVDSREVAELTREHGDIRRALAEVDVEVDLHLARHTRIDALVASLRRHAAREDALAYRWVEANVAGAARRRALARVRRSSR